MKIDDLDKFGVPFSRSFVPEACLISLFDRFGLTVDEAVQKRKEGDLPKDVLDAWAEYDKLQQEKLARLNGLDNE